MTSVFRYFQGSSGEAVDHVGRRVTNKEPKKRVALSIPPDRKRTDLRFPVSCLTTDNIC